MKNNSKNNIINIISFLVMFIMVIYISLVLILLDRKYLYVEKIFKNTSSTINSFIINNIYKDINPSEKYISYKTKYIQKEYELLRKESNLSKDNTNYILSEVVNHNNRYWFDKITINKGYEKGIIKDNPVINSDGLVGFITKTSKKASEVRLITSVGKSYVLPVLIDNNGNYLSGELSSYNYQKNLFKVTNIKNSYDINKNNEVILSSDNNLYKGIYIGKVVDIKSSNHGLTKTALVSSSVNFNNLLFLNVVIK